MCGYKAIAHDDREYPCVQLLPILSTLFSKSKETGRIKKLLHNFLCLM